jgi:hypothetical protein
MVPWLSRSECREGGTVRDCYMMHSAAKVLSLYRASPDRSDVDIVRVLNFTMILDPAFSCRQLPIIKLASRGSIKGIFKPLSLSSITPRHHLVGLARPIRGNNSNTTTAHPGTTDIFTAS